MAEEIENRRSMDLVLHSLEHFNFLHLYFFNWYLFLRYLFIDRLHPERTEVFEF